MQDFEREMDHSPQNERVGHISADQAGGGNPDSGTGIREHRGEDLQGHRDEVAADKK